MTHRHPIFCILPPHMLQEIAQKGTPAQRQTAISNLTASAEMRGRRQAMTNFAVLRVTQLVEGKQRIIYDAGQGSALPGRQIRRENDPPTGDPAADEAFDGAGATYDLFWEVYGRKSIDGKGMRIDSTVHYKRGYDNAFWNGQQMVYGDGDEDLPEPDRLFNRFTIAVDIIGHELTHGITQHEAALV
ncbi:MAG: peptidase M4 family protein, partial [Anaerolineae bacterium]